MSSSADQRARAALHERLLARRPEIEQATLTRVYAIADPSEVADPGYVQGLRAAVAAALDYAFETIERGEERAPPIPPVLLVQARTAARSGVGLDTVLRRYFAGYTLLGDFLDGEAGRGGVPGADPRRLLRGRAALFDRLLAAVSEEYARETQTRPATSEERRVERVERLLAGELLDTSTLSYDFEASHLGVVAAGREAAGAIRELASTLDCRLLLINRGETVWAWFGGRSSVDPRELQRRLRARRCGTANFAVGVPNRDIAGWRLTHRQARAALSVALRGPDNVVQYSEVAFLGSVLHDDLLATSLRQLYLTPLTQARDGGEVARQTLRAYFASKQNVSSTAALLGVSRRTVGNRLRAIEERLGHSLNSASAEIETALRLDELDRPGPVADTN